MTAACLTAPAAIIERDGSAMSGEMSTSNLGFKVSNGKVLCEGVDDRTSLTFTRRLKVTCSDGRNGVALLSTFDESGTVTFDDGTKANVFTQNLARRALTTPRAYAGELTAPSATGAEKPKEGYLVVSLLRDKSSPLGSDSYEGRVSASYSNAAHGREEITYCAPGSINVDDVPTDFENAEGDGAVYTKSLPPGTYAFYNISVSTDCGAPNTTFYSAVNFPFTIQPGRVTYVGEFHFLARLHPRFFSKPDGVVGVVVSDQSARDLPIADKKARLPPFQVDITVPAAK